MVKFNDFLIFAMLSARRDCFASSVANLTPTQIAFYSLAVCMTWDTLNAT